LNQSLLFAVDKTVGGAGCGAVAEYGKTVVVNPGEFAHGDAAQASNINPWASLEIAVEPRLSGSYVYVLGSGRKALELGRLTEGPELTTEKQFETSAFRAKSEHVFGSIVAEYRSIVRIPTT
jgi:hypothetical protein